MRWQKVARIAIAIAVVAFTILVIVALRRSRPALPTTTSPRTDEKSSTESGPGTFAKDRDGKLLFKLQFDGLTAYADGRTKFIKPRLTLPDRGGRTLELSADEMETTTSPDKSSELGTAKMTRNVRLKTSDGLEVTTADATYNQRESMIRAPGAVQFSRGRLKGSGSEATYDQAREVLWLQKDARISIAADEKGQGAAEGSATAAGFARAEHYIRLTGGGRIVGDGRTVEGDDITIQLSDDEKRIRTLQARGNSRITGSGPSPQNMAARDIDLVYAEDGRALQQATLVENASLQLAAAGGALGPRIAARTIAMGLGPDGTTVTSLTANERVQVDLPANAGKPAQRITAASLGAEGPADAGLQTATFTGGVEFRETRPAGRGTAAAERIARSQRLIVTTKPGFGDIQQADFRGNVRFEEGATVGEAPRGLYNVVDGTLQLSPSDGEPGPPPRITDERMAVDARTLTLGLETRKLTADTNVRSSLQPARKPEGREAAGRGRANGKPDQGKMPSMLKSDEPVFVHANRMEYDGTSAAIYTGDARLFQKQTTVAGETITLDDRLGNLTAEGKVRTVMMFDDVNPKTKERKASQTVATADRLVYDDAKRLATYTTGATANAHIVGPQGDLTGERIELYLKEGASELERVEADGKVSVKEGQRRARGDHLTYTAIDETYVMNGNPVEIDRYAPGECTRTLGVTVRFTRMDDTVVVDGIPGVTPFNTKPIPCQ